MTEQNNPIYLYYTTVNDSYIPQMRAAGTNLNEEMPYGKGAYLSSSANARMGVDYTLINDSDWCEEDCVRLGQEYYTMDKFAEYVASVIKTDDIDLVKKTLDIMRQKYFGDMPSNTDLYDKLGIIPHTNVHKEKQRVVDAILYSYSKNYSPTATTEELRGYTFETRDVLTNFLQTFRVDAHELVKGMKYHNGLLSLETCGCLKNTSAVGSFLRLYDIGEIDRYDCVPPDIRDNQEKFIDKAGEFIEAISHSTALFKNLDTSRVSEKFQANVDKLNDLIRYNPQDELLKKLNEYLTEYRGLLQLRKKQRAKHKAYYDKVRQGIRIPFEERKDLPTLPEMHEVRDKLLKMSSELVKFYIENAPIAEVYQAVTTIEPNNTLNERIERFRTIYNIDSFDVPVITQDMSKPDDLSMKCIEQMSQGKAQPQPNKALEFQLVVLNPESVVPSHRMGMDTKGKWEEITSPNPHKTISRTSVTRVPQKILATLDGMEIFSTSIQQGEMRLIANEEALNKLSSRQQCVLGRLLETHRVDFENIGTEEKPICALKKESIPNFQIAMRAIRRAKLENKNLPRGIHPQVQANAGR